MRVLLVQSPSGRPEPPVFPLGLAFLAGQLEGHTVSAVDLSAGRNATEVLAGAMEGTNPEVVALSLRNIDDSSYPVTWSYLEQLDPVIRALEGFRGSLLVGGPGFTINAEQMMARYGRIDAGVAGEGEEILPRLLEEPASVQGSRKLHRPPAPDLSRILPPDYSILPLGPYEPHYGIGVQSRRGCAFGCTYCTYAFLGGRGFRCRPPDRVLEDVIQLGSLGCRRFQFVDSVFDAPVDFFRTLVGRLASVPGIEWGAWVDAGIDRRDLEAMAGAGCRKVDFSPDAITASGMRRLGKRGDFGSIVSAVRAARAAGMDVGVNFFNGNPGEGLAALIGKFAFMAMSRLLLGFRHTTVNIGTIRVYKGSRLAEEMKEQGLVGRDCDFLDPVFLPARGLADTLFRGFQAIRRSRHA